ncbi:MAG: phage tail tape measure protein [Chloroflexi bacterium]|nr:phage tail tape measure protein [Chloroflexota bacterium]
MAITVAKLLVEIGANIDQALTGMEKAGQSLMDVGTSAKRAGAELTATFTLPLGIAGRQALNLTENYDRAMGVLCETSGATAEEMGLLQQKAKELGADLTLPGTSAADAAEAMLELAKSGMEINSVLSASKGVLQMSAAGQISNARAAEITSNALNAFHLEGNQAVKVADLLAAGANASSAEIQDMADALQMASAVYSAAGVPIEDLTTLIAEMANAGIKGSDAGTSLKQMMLSLQAPTAKAANLMKDLGINIYDSQGSMLPMEKIIGQFATSLSGLTQEQRNAALATIFGSDAVRAANVVLMSGADAFITMRSAVSKQGAAANLAAAQMNGLSGAFENLRSAGETTMLAAIEPFREDIINLTGSITETINTFSELDESTQKIIVGFLAAAAAAGPMLIVFGQMASGAGFLMTTLGNLPGLLSQVVFGFQAMAVGAGTVAEVATMSFGGFVAAALPAIAAIAAVGIAYKKLIADVVESGKEATESAWSDFFQKQVDSGKSAVEIANEYRAAQQRVQQTLDEANPVARMFIKNQAGLADASKQATEAILISSSSYTEYASAMSMAGLANERLAESEWKKAREVGTSAQQIEAGLGLNEDYRAIVEALGETTGQTTDQFSGFNDELGEANQKTGELISAQLSLQEELKNASGADYARMALDSLKTKIEETGDPTGALTVKYQELGKQFGLMNDASIVAADNWDIVNAAIEGGIIPIEKAREAINYFRADAADGSIDIDAFLQKFAISPDQVQPFLESIGGLETGVQNITTNLASLESEGIGHVNNTGKSFEELDTTIQNSANNVQTQFIQPVTQDLSTLATKTMPGLTEKIAAHFDSIRDAAEKAAGKVGAIHAAAKTLKDWADKNTIDIFVNIHQSGSIPSIPQPSGEAIGGSVFAGRPYIVGERGPEPFFPAINGRILSNQEAREALVGGRSSGNQYNITIQGGDGESTAVHLVRELKRLEVLHA